MNTHQPSVIRFLGEQVEFYRYWVRAGPCGHGWKFYSIDQRRSYTEILAWLEVELARAQGPATPSPWSALTSRAGSVSSPAKTRAARRNGKKGGRPKKKSPQNKGQND